LSMRRVLSVCANAGTASAASMTAVNVFSISSPGCG
jgi:hypothetical protein